MGAAYLISMRKLLWTSNMVERRFRLSATAMRLVSFAAPQSFALKPMEAIMSDIIWHDKDSPPDSPRMVIAEYREWNVASNPPREQIVQWLEGSWRLYGQMDSRAYVGRWREVPGADEITTLRARIAELEASITDERHDYRRS
jgi:hypothetical protein